jgi:hypothetical protein
MDKERFDRCGNCFKWMKSTLCPKEKNINGMNRGPNCNAPVCSQFVSKDAALAAIGKEARHG